MRRVLLSVLTIAASIAVPLGTQGQEGTDCEPCNQDYIGGIKFHRFVNRNGERCYECGTETCHSAWKQYFCDGDAHELAFSLLEFTEAIQNNDLSIDAVTLERGAPIRSSTACRRQRYCLSRGDG